MDAVASHPPEAGCFSDDESRGTMIRGDLGRVGVRLTPDEALVLSEVLHRRERSGGHRADLLRGDPEGLWALPAVLELALVEPLEGRLRREVGCCAVSPAKQ